jgi:hypothetical protein
MNRKCRERLGGSVGVITEWGDINQLICDTFKDPNSFLSKSIGSVFGSPNGPGPDEKSMKDTSGGSGPFKVGSIVDPSLSDHTYISPKIHLPMKNPSYCMGIWSLLRCGNHV